MDDYGHPSNVELLTTIDPWATWLWIAQVHLYTDFSIDITFQLCSWESMSVEGQLKLDTNF